MLIKGGLVGHDQGIGVDMVNLQFTIDMLNDGAVPCGNSIACMCVSTKVKIIRCIRERMMKNGKGEHFGKDCVSKKLNVF